MRIYLITMATKSPKHAAKATEHGILDFDNLGRANRNGELELAALNLQISSRLKSRS